MSGLASTCLFACVGLLISVMLCLIFLLCQLVRSLFVCLFVRSFVGSAWTFFVSFELSLIWSGHQSSLFSALARLVLD